MTFMHASENKTFRLVVIFLMIFALALTVARPARAIAVTSIVIPAVIATLGAWGIGTAAEGLDGDAIAEWFHEKLTSWETAAQISLANIATGIKMTPLGQVLLNPFALAGIREFGAWLVQQEGLVAGGSPVQVVTGGTTLNGYPVWTSFTVVFTNGTSRVITALNGAHLIVKQVGSSGLRYYIFGSSAFRFRVDFYNADGSLANSQTFNSNSYSSSGHSWSEGLSSVRSVNVPYVTYDWQTVMAGTGGLVTSDGDLSLVPSSSMSVPTAADVQDKELLLNTSLDVGADAAAWYESVMQKVAANDMTVTGTLTQAGTITADQVLDQGAIREEDGVVVWPDVVQPIGVTGLEDIFPFCIPFDIYHFCQALAAEPVAPSFDVPFVIPGIVDYTFHLDLEDFDQVAALLRTLELLLFCVGLAFVTRSMFIRG